MKAAARLALGLVVVMVVAILFLLPIAPIPIGPSTVPSCANPPPGYLPCTVFFSGEAKASLAYAYLGLGAVQVSNSSAGGHAYCFMYGNPGVMCGMSLERMNGR